MDDSILAQWRRHWRVLLVIALAMSAWCALDVQRRGRVDAARPDVHKTDFTVYTGAGAAFFDGREPYRVENPRGWSYLYPPFFALVIAPLGVLSPQWQVTVFFVLSVLSCYGCYLEARWLQRHFQSTSLRPWPAWMTGWPFWLLVGAAVAFPTFNNLQRGQVGTIQLYFLLAGLRLVLCAKSWPGWFAGGTLFAIPIVLKITPVLPVAALLGSLVIAACVKGNAGRATAAISGTLVGNLVVFLLFPAALVGWDANLKHLHTFYNKVVSKVGDVRDNDFGEEIDSPRNQSLNNALYRFGLWVTYVPDRDASGAVVVSDVKPRAGALPKLPVVERVVWWTNLALVCGLVLVTLRLAWRGGALAQGLSFGLACAASLIVSPVTRGHYFVLLMPLLVTLPVWLCERGRPRLALAMLVCPAVLTCCHYVTVNSLGRLGLYGLAIALWFVVALILCMDWKAVWPRARTNWRDTSDPILTYRDEPQTA